MMHIFDKEIEQLRGRTTTMGTEQYLLEREKQQGLKEGEHKKALSIAAELKKRDVSLEDIAAITGLSVKEIEKL